MTVLGDGGGVHGHRSAQLHLGQMGCPTIDNGDGYRAQQLFHHGRRVEVNTFVDKHFRVFEHEVGGHPPRTWILASTGSAGGGSGHEGMAANASRTRSS